MTEQELKKFVFSETVALVAALASRQGTGYNNAIAYFDEIYNDLMKRAKDKNLNS
ncbi:MAG: hypothetical protein WCD24_03165 [Serratia inhibens]|uniref:hypothetical protein n=1 Tax=Serratia inhibens TaxID=2338073 RepID=UPI003C7DE5C5